MEKVVKSPETITGKLEINEDTTVKSQTANFPVAYNMSRHFLNSFWQVQVRVDVLVYLEASPGTGVARGSVQVVGISEEVY